MAFLVFCTAQIPSEISKPLLLVQSPSDGVHGPELSNQHPPPLFTTGFKNATHAELVKFFKENVEDRDEWPNFRGYFASDQFVVLDERSPKDNTCLVHHHSLQMPEGSDEEYDDDKLVYVWKVWRVRFLVTWELVAGLEHGDDGMYQIWEKETNAYMDENGVFQLPHLEKYHKGEQELIEKKRLENERIENEHIENEHIENEHIENERSQQGVLGASRSWLRGFSRPSTVNRQGD